MPHDAARFLPLKPEVFEILLTLSEDELHGYAILKQLDARDVHVAPSLLYRKLRRLMDDDLVAEARHAARVDADPRRRYYRLTDRGRAVLQEEAMRIVELARNRQVRLLADEVGHA